MAADGKVTISTLLDNTGLKKALGNIGKVIATAFSVKAITDFSREAIELGSDLAEVQNVVDVSFGSMKSAAEDFAETAVTKFGMSELAAKKTSSTYMAMAKGLGVAEGAASDMAISLAGLSGDVASFYNLDQEVAAKKLQGVFTGETEALKELGVVMTQTNLKQFALSRGMNANIESMTQAELVALRYAFVTDALSLAAGDFERTQDSWANQTRILSMQWQQFMGVIGQSLTTVLLPGVKLLNSLVGVLVSAAQKIQAVVGSIFGKTAEQTQTVATAATEGAAAENELAQGVSDAAKAAKKATAGFDELNILQSGSGSSGADTVADGGTTTSVGSVSVDGEVQDGLSPKLETIASKIKGLIEPLKQINFMPVVKALGSLKTAAEPLTETLFEGLEWLYLNILVPFAAWTVEDVLPAFLGLLANGLEFLNSILEPFMSLGEWLWTEFLAPIADWTGGVIVSEIENLADALKAISDWISENQSLIEGIIIVIGSFALAWGLVTLALQAWNIAVGIWNALGAIATVVTTAFNAALAILTSPITLVVAAIGALIAIVVLLVRNWDTVKAVAAKVWTSIKNVWSQVANWFNKNVVQPIGNFFKNMVNGVIGFINGMISAVVGGINWIIKALNKLSFDVPDWVPGIGGKKLGFSIKTVTTPQIPYLAKGAVLPPNKPFMAVVGDQKNGTNIEAPLETIKQALVEALVEQGGLGGDIKIIFTGDLAQLGRVLKPVIDKEGRRIGGGLIRSTNHG